MQEKPEERRIHTLGEALSEAIERLSEEANVDLFAILGIERSSVKPIDLRNHKNLRTPT